MTVRIDFETLWHPSSEPQATANSSGVRLNSEMELPQNHIIHFKISQLRKGIAENKTFWYTKIFPEYTHDMLLKTTEPRNVWHLNYADSYQLSIS